MSTIVINGKVISGVNGNVRIDSSGNIFINGDSIGSATEDIKLIIEGDPISIESSKSVTVKGNVKGNVEAKGSVQCHDVGGYVDASGSVTCGNVAQDVKAGGSVTAGKVQGNLKAGGSVICSR